jgi:ATP-binding cassette subfamily B protein
MAAAGMVLDIIVGFVASRTGATIGRNLREQLFARVVSFSEAEVSRFSAASLITRGTNDITLIQNVSIMLMRMVLYAPILAVGGIIMVMRTNAKMGPIVVVAICAVFVVIAVLFKFAMPKFRIMQKLIDNVNRIAREILTGLAVIRAFGRGQHELERFDGASAQLMKTQLFTNRVMSFMMPTMMLIMNATSVAIVWFGGHFIDAGTIQTGQMIAFITYSMVIIMGFLMMGMISIMLPRADVAAARIDEVLECPLSIVDAPALDSAQNAEGSEGPEGSVGVNSRLSAVPETKRSGVEGVAENEAGIRDAEGVTSAASSASDTFANAGAGAPAAGARIAFENVTFAYSADSQPVLENVSFEAAPGTTLAIIGATGCGKSTVLKLIERFYDVQSGRVTIDGVDVRDIPQARLRAQLGYVPQKAFLFAGTVESNVLYGQSQGNNAQNAEAPAGAINVAQALEISQSDTFVSEMEGGTQAEISQGGANVSGGQRQRLCIARAVSQNARAYLFDDSFSALDYKTDAAVRDALTSQLGHATRIIVAQRIATIMAAEHIVVLDDGRVVGQGTHAQLMQTCAEYKEIALSQLSEAELGIGGDAA